MAFLVVLESMAPAERVAFILHDVFRYSFAEVAGIVGRTPAACRQLAYLGPPPHPRGAAHRHLDGPPRRHRQGLQACMAGHGHRRPHRPARPDATLATLVADGGGVAGAALRPIDGAERIVRALLNLAGRLSNLTILERTVNGQPGLVVQQDGVIVTVAAFDVEGDQIKRIWGVRNPDKLRPWTAAPERAAGR
ncbi:sigma factor-like helix-turn-helix DNA-binding protein [Sphaerisporangium sp. B11E5]|uniref:sigma factor-like helix-turn-helix DNA-binding protein n=1 Tax=Sphaerisporangium sp. B11E5 TaxID=3153563 RepID=UPI00325EF2C7